MIQFRAGELTFVSQFSWFPHNACHNKTSPVLISGDCIAWHIVLLEKKVLTQTASPHQTPLSFFGWFRSSAYVWTSLHSPHLCRESDSGSKVHYIHFLQASKPHSTFKQQMCTFTARALNKEVDQVQEGNIPILFVCLDPVINDRLKKKNKTWPFKIRKRKQDIIPSSN